jgi:hypothetical protein
MSRQFNLEVCDDGISRLWTDPGGAPDSGIPMVPGWTIDIYVVDLGPDSVVFAAVRTEGATAEQVAQLEQVVASIQFEEVGG